MRCCIHQASSLVSFQGFPHPTSHLTVEATRLQVCAKYLTLQAFGELSSQSVTHRHQALYPLNHISQTLRETS